MRLELARRSAVLPPTVPMADLALLLVLLFAIVALYASAKGLGMRLADPAVDPLPATSTTGAVWIRVAADGGIRLDGAPTDDVSLRARLRDRLRATPAATVVIWAESDASYQSVVTACDAVIRAVAPAPAPRIAVPSSRQVEDWVRATGRNPFEGAP